MTHGYHEGHPGYSPAQILHDGCSECAERSRDVSLAIGHLDPVAFAQAWHRASAGRGTSCLADVSAAEIPLLDALWAVQVQLERRGLPIGHLPNRDTPGGGHGG